jgi:peptide-methionine (R)-S-oxide reductase
MFFPENKNPVRPSVGRRAFLLGSMAATAALAWFYSEKRQPANVHAAISGLPKMVTIIEFTDNAERKSSKTLERITKTEDEWRRQLSAASFEVTRHAGTERPYTNENSNHHAKGVFRCICCDTALFDSETKFDSGTGWPSFWAPIAKENVLETTDSTLGMTRTEVTCRLCDAHLGHVFDDGPKPTGLRYCMNSVSLKFDKAA